MWARAKVTVQREQHAVRLRPPTGSLSHGQRCLLERLLHQDRAEPAVELEADTAHAPDLLEPELLVEADRALRTAVGDDGNDLLDTSTARTLDEFGHEGAAETLAGRRRAEVDGVLYREAVGRLLLPRVHVGEAQDLSRRAHRDEEGKAQLL